MPVFPPKTASIAKVYPPAKGAEDALEVIGLPDVIFRPYDGLVKVWKDLTTLGKKKEEKEPKPVPLELAYEKEIPILPRGYRIAGDGGDAESYFNDRTARFRRNGFMRSDPEREAIDNFYRKMSEKYDVPITGVSYYVMDELLGRKPKNFIAGLHVPKIGIYVTEDMRTEYGLEPISLVEIKAATGHEIGHEIDYVFTGSNRSEKNAQSIGKRVLRENGHMRAADFLAELEKTNPHLLA